MKIADIRTLSLSRLHEPERQWFTAKVHCPKADCAIVIIDTDQGLQGIGEACAYGVPPEISQKVARLKPQLVGRDPLEPDLLPPNSGVRSDDIPLAGINAALWDIRGKAAGQRVSELLASPDRPPLDRVRLYASAGLNYDWDDRPESVIDEILRFADQGFTGYKMRMGTSWAWSGVTVARFLKLARRIVDAAGDRLELMLDAGCMFDEAEGLEMAWALDEMGWTWFEEPLPKDQLEGYARLNQAVDMAISGGESFTTLADFEVAFPLGSFAIVQPDAGVCSIDEALRIGRRAHEFGVPLVPHNWHNGLMTMANAHLVAALPAPRVLELNMVQGPLQWEILREKPLIRDGHLELPDAPGLGVELADDLEERFPYIEGSWAAPVERRPPS